MKRINFYVFNRKKCLEDFEDCNGNFITILYPTYSFMLPC